jgi:hypothetical protein
MERRYSTLSANRYPLSAKKLKKIGGGMVSKRLAVSGMPRTEFGRR